MLTLLLTAALSGAWDDETFLGRGPTAGAGAAWAITQNLSVEGEADWSTNHRDSGYLKVDGNAFTAAGRLSYAFRRREAAVRPFVSAGVVWRKSTDLFTSEHLTLGPNGSPVPAPAERATYRTSLGGYELGTGVEIKATDNFRIRPEARWTFTKSDPSFQPGSLEPPIFIIRGGVTLLWNLRN
jgi:opacity protein-like surface antigen